MIPPSSYDQVKLNYWLWFNYLCHECTATEFQRMFENIMERADPSFMQVRSYGNIGDRKADGLCRYGKTIFQVYSPDDFTQEKVVSKIDEDLEGAVKEWGDEMEEWIFVYNARRGLPPDIPKILRKKQNQYHNIKIGHMSKVDLWGIAEKLPFQQLAEVLGNPASYGGDFVPSINPTQTTMPDATQSEWVVLIQDVLMPIDVRAVVDALKPDIPYGSPVFISPESSSFEKAADYQKNLIQDLQAKGRRILPARYAVFSLAPIPLIAQLGFLLTDSVEVKYFKFHVDKRTWKWPTVDPEEVDLNIRVSGLPIEIIQKPTEVVIRISISSQVWEQQVEDVVPGLPIQTHIFVDHPSLTWIRSEAQIERFATVFRNVLAEIRAKVPRCNGIHLFIAAPAPIVLAVGQQINPRMNPPVHLYEFSRQSTPNYTYALSLR